jgi:hypothetical protein
VLARGLRNELGLLNPTLLMNRNPSRLVQLNEEVGMFKLTRGSLFEAELVTLVAEVKHLRIRSNTVSSLGSRLGGLPCPEVRQRIWQHLRSLAR